MKLDEIDTVMNLVLRLMGECPVRLKANGVDEIGPCWVSYNELTEILKPIKELIYLSVSLDGIENPKELIESNRVKDEQIRVMRGELIRLQGSVGEIDFNLIETALTASNGRPSGGKEAK